MKLERLDKFISNQVTTGRAEIKKKIYMGQVTVNGKVVTSPSAKINPESDIVALDGVEINFKEHIYLMMNKPAGVVTAVTDKNDKTVIDIVPEQFKRKGLFPVGRLDKDTEGLLIITNDGDFAHKVTSPNKNIYKTYHATIDSEITQDDIDAFERGIVFKDGTICKKAFLKPLKTHDEIVVEVKICEGMFHQVKKMLIVRGKKVLYLKRVAIGNLILSDDMHKKDVVELDKLEINNIFIGEMH